MKAKKINQEIIENKAPYENDNHMLLKMGNSQMRIDLLEAISNSTNAKRAQEKYELLDISKDKKIITKDSDVMTISVHHSNIKADNKAYFTTVRKTNSHQGDLLKKITLYLITQFVKKNNFQTKMQHNGDHITFGVKDLIEAGLYMNEESAYKSVVIILDILMGVSVDIADADTVNLEDIDITDKEYIDSLIAEVKGNKKILFHDIERTETNTSLNNINIAEEIIDEKTNAIIKSNKKKEYKRREWTIYISPRDYEFIAKQPTVLLDNIFKLTDMALQLAEYITRQARINTNLIKKNGAINIKISTFIYASTMPLVQQTPKPRRDIIQKLDTIINEINGTEENLKITRLYQEKSIKNFDDIDKIPEKIIEDAKLKVEFYGKYLNYFINTNTMPESYKNIKKKKEKSEL